MNEQVTGARVGWLAGLIAAVAALLLPALPARAAPPKVKIVAVNPLMTDFLVAERFNVLRVYLTSDVPLTGEVRLQFDQDASQRAVIVAPFSTTPGQMIPVDLVAAFPDGLETATLTAGDARIRLDRGFGGNALPRVLRTGVVAVVTPPGRDALARGLRDIPPGDPQTTPPREFISVTPDQMPRQWIGLDAVDAVVIGQDALELLDAAQARALRSWLETGGEVVLILGPAGSSWRELLGDGPAAEFLDIGDQTQRQLSGVEVDAFDLPASDEVVYRMPARPIRLSARARDLGWLPRGPARNNGASDLILETVAAEAALIAAGPVGLGRLTVLGFDPLEIHPLQKSAVAPRVIVGVLPATTGEGNRFGWYGSMSGRDYVQNTVLQSAVDAVVRAPVFGLWALIAVGVGVTALGLMLSVFDGLYLKRKRLQHRSWLTAIGWIMIASVIAFTAPALLRDGDSQVGHAVWIDAVDQGDGPAIARRAEIITVFSGRPQFAPMDPGSDRAWVRGVSPQYYFSRAGLLPPLILPQSNDRRADTGSTPPGVACPQWSLRVLAAVSPAAPITIDGAAERVGDEWRIRVTGLPDEIRPDAGKVLIGGAWTSLEIDGAAEGPDRVYYARPERLAAGSVSTSTSHTPAVAFGHTQRTALLHEMTHSGRFALLNLAGSANSDVAPPVRLGEPTSMHRRVELLLVIPVIGEPAAALTAAAPPRTVEHVLIRGGRLWPDELPRSAQPATSPIPEEFAPQVIIESPMIAVPPPIPQPAPQEDPE